MTVFRHDDPPRRSLAIPDRNMTHEATGRWVADTHACRQRADERGVAMRVLTGRRPGLQETQPLA